MQAGYRTKPNESAKALKARIKNKKLDNALYGSDVKNPLADLSTTSSSSVQTDTPTTPDTSSVSGSQKKASAAAASLASVSSEPMAVSTAPSSPAKATVKPNSSVQAQMAELLKAGPISPSQLKKSKQTTTATTSSNVQRSKQDVELTEDKRPIPTIDVGSAKPLTQAPPNTSPKKLVDEFYSVARSEDGSISPSKVKENANLIKQAQKQVVSPKSSETAAPNTADEAIGKDRTLSDASTLTATNSSSQSISSDIQNEQMRNQELAALNTDFDLNKDPNDDDMLQGLAQQVMDKQRQMRLDEGKPIPKKERFRFRLYKHTPTELTDPTKMEDQLASIIPHNDKWGIYLMNKAENGSYRQSNRILNQTEYNLRVSVWEALQRLNAVNNPNIQWGKDNNLKGYGLEDGRKLIWKHRRSDGDPKAKYVLLPHFMKGNVKVYGSTKKAANVSYNNASPAFLRIVRDVVDSGTFQTADYNAVDPKEARYVNEFIRFAKPLIPNGTHFTASNASDIYELRKRYQVLVGELAAGNHGQMIKDEMIGILRDLQRLKAISVSKVQNLIKGLKEL